MTERDIIIIGAGPAGSTAARLLKQHDVNVTLVDRASFPRDKTCGDGLTPRAVGMLEKLGVIETFSETGKRIENARVVAPNSTGILDVPMPAPRKTPPYLYTIPRLTLDDALLQHAIADGVEFLDQFNVTEVNIDADAATVIGKHNGDPVELTAKAVVLAVGANMKLLKTLGFGPADKHIVLAARRYYKNVSGLSGNYEFRFDGVPLPGYGWVFPLAEDGMANVGVGMFPKADGSPLPMSSRQAFDQFVANPAVAEMLADADPVGPVRGFPIRSDFLRSKTHSDRLLLIGEAIGLVNPLTGEGIDYAMESAEIATHHLLRALSDNEFSKASFAAYDAELREKYGWLFKFCETVLNKALNKTALNTLVTVAKWKPNLKELFSDIVLGTGDFETPVTRRQILKEALWG